MMLRLPLKILSSTCHNIIISTCFSSSVIFIVDEWFYMIRWFYLEAFGFFATSLMYFKHNNSLEKPTTVYTLKYGRCYISLNMVESKILIQICLHQWLSPLKIFSSWITGPFFRYWIKIVYHLKVIALHSYTVVFLRDVI